MNPMDPDPAATAAIRRPEHVLVSYDSSRDGRAALSHARDIADAAGAQLSVIAVMPYEPTNVGCTRCRWNAAMWNRELERIAKEELVEAARLVGDPPTVGYEVARGTEARAIAEAALRRGADLIVVPWRRPGRVRRLFARDPAELLRSDGRWQVVIAPAATATPNPREPSDLSRSGRHPAGGDAADAA
jgi:nucleotide-binding universal stress UspA family protein